MTEAKVNGRSTTFLYDAGGERTVKRGQGGETLYVNKYYQLQNRDVITKHIFVGLTRIVSKLAYYNEIGEYYDSTYESTNQYFYHPDHLGSSNFITDYAGNEFEHIEYMPYGETWIDEGSNTHLVGYRFTGKELDESTGLYYFGARYLDPQVSRWISTDPGIGDYMPVPPYLENAQQTNGSLPGQGGVFNPINMSLYRYSGNNPVKYVDPDGQVPLLVITGAVGAVVGGGIEAYRSYRDEGEINWGRVGKGAAIGGAIGLGAGAGASLIASDGTAATLTTAETIAGISALANSSADKAYGGLQYASRYGIDTYNNLRRVLKGTGLQAHHIIEKRFADLLGSNQGLMKSVTVTKAEHQVFTNLWRKLIPYGTDYQNLTKEDIWNTAQLVYKESPELLKAAYETIFGLN